MSVGRAVGRKFQPRMPRETLLVKTTEALQQSGVGNHSHARFAMKIARAVLQSEDPLLATLHAAPKYRNEEAWARAFNVVEKFLEQAQMAMTIKTMSRELGDRRSEVLDFLGHTSSAKVIGGLVRFGLGVEADPMPDQVAAFCRDRIVRKTNRQIQARRFFPDGAPKLIESREAEPRSARKARPSERGMPRPREAVVTSLEDLPPPKRTAPQKKPEPAPVKRAEVVPVKKPVPQKKPEPVTIKRSDAVPPDKSPTPFKKPTIQDRAKAPNPVKSSSSGFEPSSPSTSKVITSGDTLVEDFSEESVQEEHPSSSVVPSAGSEDLEVTIQGPDSDGDDVSIAIKSEVVDSGQIHTFPVSSIVAAGSTPKPRTGNSEFGFEYVNSQDSGTDDSGIAIVDDFDDD